MALIFQVAAHNANGWGAWSASTAGCTLTAAIGETFTYIINGLDRVPPLPETIPADPTSPVFPTVELAFQDSVGPQGVSLFKLTPGGGTFVKGTYTFDFYVALPTRGTSYTFSIGGSSLAATYLGTASALGSGHPTYYSTDPTYFSRFEVYGFTITTGTVLTITIL